MAVTEYFIRYLQQRDDLSDADIARLRAIQTETVYFGGGEVIVEKGCIGTRSCMMLRGMSARQHKLAHRPGERVITALHIPGDFIGSCPTGWCRFWLRWSPAKFR